MHLQSPFTGLSLTLDIEQDEYIGPISTEAGIRVKLHNQGVMPFPFEGGFSISPGMATSVGIRKVRTTNDATKRGEQLRAMVEQILYPQSIANSFNKSCLF